MEEEEVLGLERRRAVYQFIRSHPGFHMRALEKRLNISLGDLRYHLDYLERKKLITSRSDGYRKTYFSVRDVRLQDRDMLALLRQRTPRKIVLHLLRKRMAGFEDLCDALKVSKSTLSFHMKKLTDSGMIQVRKEERRSQYSLGREEDVARLLITYKKTFFDEAVDRALEVWLQ